MTVVQNKFGQDSHHLLRIQIVDNLLELFKISRRFTLPYRPEANGLVERVNQETMKILRAITYEGGVKRNWSQYLPLVQRIINNSFHSAIGTTPSRVVFGDRIFLDRGFDKILQQPKNFKERKT